MRTPSLAVIGAAVVLTLGASAGGFAAGMITGRDIVDGTVASVDVKNQTLKLRDLAPRTISGLAPRVIISRKGSGSYLTDDSSTVFHTMTVPAGKWLVTVTATAFPDGGVEEPWVNCFLDAPAATAGQTTTSIAGDDFYAALGTQIAFTAFASAEVSFECAGDNAGVNEVTLTAVEVSKITDKSP
jgi:hypothetical protein